MRTYELLSAFEKLNAMLEAEEIDEEMYKDTLEAMPIAETAEQLARIKRNLEGDEKKIANEIERLRERKERLRRSQERIKKSIVALLDASGGKLTTDTFAIRKTKSIAVVIENDRLIPDKFKKVSMVETPDKQMIKQALQDGAEIDGCYLEERYSMVLS